VLTGLGNRRRFDETLEQEWGHGLRSGYPLAVVLIDVDHFKLFNDRYGDRDADDCLAAVAATLVESLHREGDVATRYGEEEFGVILPRTAVHDAARVAERIRQNLARKLVKHLGSPYGVVTLSIGVAGAVPGASGSPEQLLRAAEQALLTSTQEGRDRTTLLEVNWQ
jgi:diguanylate cyclase (GGDEF)-like protein